MPAIFKPINNYVSLEMVEKANPLVLLSDYAQKEYRWGKVLDTGAGVPDFNGDITPPVVQPGDIAYVMAHGRELVNLELVGGQDIHVASELDIMCTIEDEDSMKLKPLGVYIEIEKVDKEEQKLVLLPDSKTTPTHLGRVVSLGKGWKDIGGATIEHQVAVGDLVAFNGYSPCIVDLEPLGINEKRFLIMHTDIYGVVSE